MQLVKKILTRFNGLHYPQEYLCFEKGSFYQPIHVYLTAENHVIKDITNQHLFIGYCPLLFALAGENLPDFITLTFSHRLLAPNESFDEEDALARLEMKQVKKKLLPHTCLYYFEGVAGVHDFLSPFQQRIGSFINERYNKKPGNVFLHDNLYKQVQIAYSVPRIISLITVNLDGLYNLFPTDLHGPVGENHYLISLRMGGKALAQVEAAGKILISQVHARAYATMYELGKNHMQEPRPIANFPMALLHAETLQYRELELIDSSVQGIHKILLFLVRNQKQIGPESACLAHIHNSYATWRHKCGLSGNYLLR